MSCHTHLGITTPHCPTELPADSNASLQAALQYLLELVPPALSSNAHLYNSILAQSLARGRPYRAQAVLTAMQSWNVPWDPATWCSAFKLQVMSLLIQLAGHA